MDAPFARLLIDGSATCRRACVTPPGDTEEPRVKIDQHAIVCQDCRSASPIRRGRCEQCGREAATSAGSGRAAVILAGGAFVGIAAAMVVAAVTDSAIAAAVVVGGSVVLAMTAALVAD
jgi:hypothetical protein